MAMRANPGKFNTALDESVWSLSLDGGADEEVGSSTEAPGTWAGILHDGDGLARAIEGARDEYPNVTKTELEFLRESGAAGVILTEDSQGFVQVKYYESNTDLEKDWSELEEDLAVDDDEHEPNGREGNVGTLAKMPLPKLRRHQALNAKQIEAAHRAGNTRALEELQAREREIDQAIMRREFGHTRNGERPVLDRNRIQKALAYVHHWESPARGKERQSTRAAADYAARMQGLNDEERRVLFSALHIEASQRPPSHKKNSTISDRRKAGIIEGLTKAEMDSMEFQIPTFDWKQVGGDMDPGKHGGMIARADGYSINMLEIQPVRSLVGDDEAKDVGFPFWKKEGTYDLDDLSLSDEHVQGAIEYSGLGEHLLEMTPEQRALAIADACMQAGYRSEEAEGGWAKNVLGSRIVQWMSGQKEGYEYIADEDDEFRREILGERYEVLVDGEHESWFSEDDGEDDAIEHAESLSGHVQVKDAFDGEIMWDSNDQEEGEHEPNPPLNREKIRRALEEARAVRTRRGDERSQLAVAKEIAARDGLSPEERRVMLTALRASPSHSPNAGGEGASHYRSISEIKAANEAAGFYFFKKDTIKFWKSKIEPRVYGGRYFITSEQMDDASPRLFSVREAAPSGRVTTVASGLRGKGAAEDAIDALLGQHTPNAPHPALERDGVLDSLLEVEAELMEPDGRGRVPREVKNALRVTDGLRRAVTEYEMALQWALDEVVMRHPPADGASAAVLFEDNAPYLVLMTLRGEGVGIWDGDWDAHYDSDEIKKVGRTLKNKLSMYADDTGGGKISDELRSAVEEAMGEAGYEFDEHTYVKIPEGEMTHNQAGHKRWHVFLNGELLEPVYVDPSLSADEVKRHLIEAGYSSDIVVDQPPDRRSRLPTHYRAKTLSQNRSRR